MKILMIGPLPDPINGQSIANKMLLDGLKREGHSVEYIDTNTEKEFKNFSEQGKFNYRKIVNSILPIFRGLIKIMFHKFDIIYITPAQSYIGFLKYCFFINAAHVRNIPCYIHFHGGYVRQMYDGLPDNKKIKIKKYFNKCSGVIVLGNSLRKMFYGLVPEDKIYVCENGVQNEIFIKEQEINIKHEKVKLNSKIKLLYLSNLMETKGILDLLEACVKLKEKAIDFEIHIAGNIEPAVKEKVSYYFDVLKENLVYHGVVTGEQKRELLKDSGIFCLPTYYPNEGQPISILEAMAMGCTIVTTYQGGITDIFKDKVNGIKCEPRNPDSICNAIVEANKNIDKFIDHNCSAAADYYTEEKFTQRIIKIINQ